MTQEKALQEFRRAKPEWVAVIKRMIENKEAKARYIEYYEGWFSINVRFDTMTMEFDNITYDKNITIHLAGRDRLLEYQPIPNTKGYVLISELSDFQKECALWRMPILHDEYPGGTGISYEDYVKLFNKSIQMIENGEV